MDTGIKEVLEDDHRDGWGDVIATALVVATLIGACIVWAQAQASFEHEEAAVRAEEWTVLASSQRGRADQAAQLQIARSRLAHRDRIGSEQVAARRLFAHGDPAVLAMEGRQWSGLASRIEQGSHDLAHETTAELRKIEGSTTASFPDIDPHLGRLAPCELKARPPPPTPPALTQAIDFDQSSRFLLNRYLMESRREAFRMEGLRDAATETTAHAEEQFAHYAASLTAIAVALFLFGYALTKYGERYRRMYAVFAGVLTLAALLWGAYSFDHRPEKPHATAAAAYADGRVALYSGRYRIALKDLACATHLNPDFANAYLLRSDAFDQRGSRNQAVVSEDLANPEDLRRALEYGQRARQLDPEDPQSLTQIATALYVQGVNEHDPAKLARALNLDRQAATAQQGNPVPAFNVGTTLLALGRPWRQSYRRAEGLTEHTANSQEYIGSALTDLDYLGSSGLRPNLRAEADAAKEQVVASASRGMSAAFGGSQRSATLHHVSFEVAATSVSFGFVATDLRPARNQLFAAWYRREPRGWRELPLMSDPVSAPGQIGRDRYVHLTSRDISDTCLESGTYRVEPYVNGRLAKTDSPPRTTVRFPQWAHSSLKDLNVGLCRPRRGWHRISHRIAGVVDGFESQSPTGRSGVVVFNVSESSAHGFRAMVDAVLKHFSPPLPSGIEPTGLPSHTLPICPLTHTVVTSYEYQGGCMLMTAATTPIGRKLVVAVFGPEELFAQTSRSSPSVGLCMLDSLFTRDVNLFGR